LIVVLVTGCGRKPVQEPSAVEKVPPAGGVEVRVGGPEADEGGRLAFTITVVHEGRKPSDVAPFHVGGGEWTFFDCRAGADPEAVFTVGVWAKGSADGAPVAWGRAVLAVRDREAGRRFVALFHKSFAGTMPKPRKQHHLPKPLFINTAALGEDLNRETQGGFSGKGGGWTATKWFPEHDDCSGEVYFNFNLGQRRGEFSEKDAGYRDDLLALFASALRDGPRPQRTPANDPNLTLIGPKIGQPRKLLPRLASQYLFSPDGLFAVYQDGPTVLALAAGRPAATAVEVARFNHAPWEVHVVGADLTLLVQEGVPKEPGVKSSTDPMRVWWVEPKSNGKKLLRGPQQGLNLAEAPVSPNRRYVAFYEWRTDPGGKGRTKVLLTLDRKRGGTKVFSLKGKDLSLVGWRKTGSGLRGVAVTNRWRLDKEAPEAFLLDPSTGKLEHQGGVDTTAEIDDLVSPDKAHWVRVGKGELVFTGGKGKRLFVLHEDDRRFVGQECVEWVSPRYLKFNGPRLALIDVTTMKMCFPASADGGKHEGHSYKFSSDFRWVLYQGKRSDGEGLFLAPVELPRGE
jgi:hypothetical protein